MLPAHFPRNLQGRAKASQATVLAKGLRRLDDLALPDLAALLGQLLPADFLFQGTGRARQT